MSISSSTLKEDRTRDVVRDYDVQAVRRRFRALDQLVHGRPLSYLDNAATTQKPDVVIEAVTSFYLRDCANVHRSAYELGARASEKYERTRSVVQRFIGAAKPEEIVFVRGATEAINVVAAGFSLRHLRVGDQIIISALEHHSNIVPWQMACERTGARLRVIPVDDRGVLDIEAYERMLDETTKLVAVAHVSNVLGTVNPARRMIEMAHARGVPVLIDGAQAVPHSGVNVSDLDADFYVFSGHKVYGPTGIGVLYGKYDALDALPPYQGGGDMIRSVTFEKTEYAPLPSRLEAGTPHVAGAIGLAAALELIEQIGLERIAQHEAVLLSRLTDLLTSIEGVRVIGTAPNKAAVVSFTLEGVHPHDLATVLDLHGVAIRAGHHCAQPLMNRFGVPATARASLGLYNTELEVETLARGVLAAKEVFRR